MFKSFDKFIYRTTLLPFESNSYTSELENLLRSDYYKDILYISSSDLFQALSAEEKDNKKENKINFSLLKYYLRSKFRCTPFGLLAGIGIGNLNDQQSSIDL